MSWPADLTSIPWHTGQQGTEKLRTANTSPMSIAIGQTLPVIGFLGSFYGTYEEMSCLSFYDLLLVYYPLV